MNKKNTFLFSIITLLFSALLCIQPVSAETNKITIASIKKFLAHQDQLLIKKDIESFVDLFVDDFKFKNEEGNIEDKRSLRLIFYNKIISSKHYLHKSTFKSAEISPDSKSARVNFISNSKTMFNYYNQDIVIPVKYEDEAILIIENGNIKYKSIRSVKEL